MSILVFILGPWAFFNPANFTLGDPFAWRLDVKETRNKPCVLLGDVTLAVIKDGDSLTLASSFSREKHLDVRGLERLT